MASEPRIENGYNMYHFSHVAKLMPCSAKSELKLRVEFLPHFILYPLSVRVRGSVRVRPASGDRAACRGSKTPLMIVFAYKLLVALKSSF